MAERIPEHLARLLGSSVESLERLDLLLHVRAARGKKFTAGALADLFGLPAVSAEQHLAILCGRGFLNVSIGSDLLYTYHPVSPAIDGALAELETLNRERRPDVVAALGGARSPDPVRAFADAFVIRAESSKGTRDG
jgi:hypothetical protein